MIFFEENISPFVSNSGMQITPIECTLIDERKGYCLPNGCVEKEVLEAKGATVEKIEKSQIKQESHYLIYP